MEQINKTELQQKIESNLMKYFSVGFEEATEEQIYKGVVITLRNIMALKRRDFNRKVKNQQGKRVYYMCMEFLIGKSLKNNLYNLDLTDTVAEILEHRNIKLESLYGMETDAALGNGGLGRLASCFMDGLASNDYPAMGFSLRYEYGLFKQKIVDGWQTELPDIWLPEGEAWLVPRTDKLFDVKFDGKVEHEFQDGKMITKHYNPTIIQAMPYDMFISGKDSEAVNVLRLWRAQSKEIMDMKSFSQGDYFSALKSSSEAEVISKVLYPSDDHFEGKTLRLKQQYFLVSASIQNIIQDHLKVYPSLDNLSEKVAIHINDTHPALCIPELMRILMDEHNFGWDKAWEIVTETVAYTNHTVLCEALEKWGDSLIQTKLPRIYEIIREINERNSARLWNKYPGDWAKIERMAILSQNEVRMANLSVIGSHSVNGVSALHSEIIKESVFKDFYIDTPNKFKNVTNGIAHRRWLNQSNPYLCELLLELGISDVDKHPNRLSELKKFENDVDVLKRIDEIKMKNKIDFCNYLKREKNLIVDPNTMFDVQAKRLHEYKRQLLNVLKIITKYNELKENPDKEVIPSTFIFSAKAAQSYYNAKQIIRLICSISAEIDKQPKIKEKLNVVFVEDYNVTVAEHLMPASEISEQISLAGKEASGTGNMKFMINGAITLGTLDGANVEILEHVGDDNIFIFGNTAEQVEELWKKGYSSASFYQNNPSLTKAIDSLKVGFNKVSFLDVYQYLISASGVADPYMCLADYDSYMAAFGELEKAYLDKNKWNKMALNNIAGAGFFACDRSIKEYSDTIWHIKPIK